MATPKTFEELHEEARGDFVQSACNLSGLVHSFSRVMTRLWEIQREDNPPEERQGTAWVNSNAVTRLWIDKMRSLTGETTTKDWIPDNIPIANCPPNCPDTITT